MPRSSFSKSIATVIGVLTALLIGFTMHWLGYNDGLREGRKVRESLAGELMDQMEDKNGN